MRRAGGPGARRAAWATPRARAPSSCANSDTRNSSRSQRSACHPGSSRRIGGGIGHRVGEGLEFQHARLVAGRVAQCALAAQRPARLQVARIVGERVGAGTSRRKPGGTSAASWRAHVVEIAAGPAHQLRCPGPRARRRRATRMVSAWLQARHRFGEQRPWRSRRGARAKAAASRIAIQAIGGERGERAFDEIGAQAIGSRCRPRSRGAADSIAAYSSAVFGWIGSCLRACFSLSASARRSRRRTPCGWRRSASSRLGMHGERDGFAAIFAAPDTPARRRRRERDAGIGCSGKCTQPCCARPSAARAANAACARARRSARADPRDRAIRRARRFPALSRHRAAAGSRAGAARSTPASNSVASNRHAGELVQEARERAFDRIAPSVAGSASANARAKSGAGTKLRRKAFGSDLISAVALSATKPGASHDSRAASSALSRCSGTTTVMPSSGAPGSKRYRTASRASPSGEIRRKARRIAFVADHQVGAATSRARLLFLRQARIPRIQRLRVVHVRRQAIQVPLRLPVFVDHQAGAALLGFFFLRLRERREVARQERGARVDLARHQRIAREDLPRFFREQRAVMDRPLRRQHQAEQARSVRCRPRAPANAPSADRAGVARAGAATRRSPTPVRSSHWSTTTRARCRAGSPTTPTAAVSSPAANRGTTGTCARAGRRRCLRSRAVADLRRQAGRATRDAGPRTARLRRSGCHPSSSHSNFSWRCSSRHSRRRRKPRKCFSAHWRNFDCVRSSCACRYASHSLTMPTNSDFGSANSACALSAAARWSTGRSRGSWMPRKAVIASISRKQPRSLAAMSMRASFTSTGSRAIVRPIARELARALVALFDRTEFEQLLPTIGDRARLRRFEEREVLDAPQAQRQHPQDHARQRGAADFRIGEARTRLEIGFRIQAIARARRDAPAAALALVGAGLADRLDVQAIEFLPRAVTLHAREARIDDRVDARHRQRGFGDVGREHDAPLRAGIEHAVLVLRGQARVERQDFGVAIFAAFQRLVRVADLALAGQEDQRVAHRMIARDFVACTEDAVEHGAIAGVLALAFDAGASAPPPDSRGLRRSPPAHR